MSSTPKSMSEEILNDSWIEVSSHEEASHRTTPVSCFLGSSVEKMLLDAQRESSRASVLSSSNRSSERGSPKIPCTPSEDLHPGLNVLSTQSGIARRKQGSTDWIWDWSSRPDILPPKKMADMCDKGCPETTMIPLRGSQDQKGGWNLRHPAKSNFSIRNSKAAKYLFSREILRIVILSNILTLVIGASFGFLYACKKYGVRTLTRVLK